MTNFQRKRPASHASKRPRQHGPTRQTNATKPAQGSQGCCKETMRAISAPYNFVPLADWVYLPEWAKGVSHDWPFEDGLSGEIHYSLHADSPLLVGGRQQKATGRQPGEVWPFQLPDDRYAIPGSSLKGMLRAVVEIIGFGRMRGVDERRPGLRDITGPYVKKSYLGRIKNVKTGFLQTIDGKLKLIPCFMRRLNHRDLEEVLGVSEPIFKKQTSVKDKYTLWGEICHRKKHNPDVIQFNSGSPDATALFEGAETGTPVLTEQISDSSKSSGKARDFIFYAPREDQALNVSAADWRDFLLLHGDGENASRLAWPDYWRRRFQDGHRVPVFYLHEGPRLHIGLAYLLKLAGDYSTLDLIGHAALEHLNSPGEAHGYDLADLLFGAIGETPQDALRGRVNCETAIADSAPTPTLQPPSILSSPKPTYFPNYLVQPTDPGGLKLDGGQYATYIKTEETESSTLRGFKRYPARPPQQTHVQALTSEQTTSPKVQVCLHTLPVDTRFSGRIVFHNLKPVELGALLWAISLDGNPSLRHGLGMGKSFGFGQVHIEIKAESSRVVPNDPKQIPTDFSAEVQQHYRDLFEAQMEQADDHGHRDWRNSPQIINLLAMADPAAAEHLPAGMQLRHMRLEAKSRINEFTWAKQGPQGPFVLADYAKATGWDQRLRQQAREAYERAEERKRQAAATQAEAALIRETANLPKDATQIERLRRSGKWTDNGTFVASLLEMLEKLDTRLSAQAYTMLVDDIKQRLPGLLNNPYAVTLKSQKQKFGKRQIKLAEIIKKQEPLA